jgi:hypothetical protein
LIMHTDFDIGRSLQRRRVACDLVTGLLAIVIY